MQRALALKNDIEHDVGHEGAHVAALTRLIPCHACPLRRHPHFLAATPEETDFIAGFKIGEVNAAAGNAVYMEGVPSPHLFTVLSGWAFRYKTLPDGRRQILNYVMPGDFLGLQATLDGAMEHGVEALTDLRLCAFSRNRLDELFRHHPGLARDLTWIAAHDERLLDDHLLAVGRRRADERIAYLFWQLAARARARGLAAADGAIAIPASQQHLADTLGMSLVTFNKTLQRVRAAGAFTFADRRLIIHDEDRMRALAAVDDAAPTPRPFI